MTELKTVADGQLYLIVEVALQRFIEDLKAREPGIEVIQVSQLEPGPEDEHLLDQRAAQAKKATAAKKKTAKPKN